MAMYHARKVPRRIGRQIISRSLISQSVHLRRCQPLSPSALSTAVPIRLLVARLSTNSTIPGGAIDGTRGGESVKAQHGGPSDGGNSKGLASEKKTQPDEK